MTFEEFVRRDGVRLRAGLVAAYGPDVGADAAAEALAYGFEHWDRVGGMDNPAGYLYRVGQSEARRHFRPSAYLPTVPTPGLPDFEPALAPALESLTEPQRVGVVGINTVEGGQVFHVGWIPEKTQLSAAEDRRQDEHRTDDAMLQHTGAPGEDSGAVSMVVVKVSESGQMRAENLRRRTPPYSTSPNRRCRAR